MRKYEIMVIFDAKEDSLEKNKSFISTTLSNNSIKITKEKDIGLRDLSFEINRKNKGHYYLYLVETKNRMQTQIILGLQRLNHKHQE